MTLLPESTENVLPDGLDMMPMAWWWPCCLGRVPWRRRARRRSMSSSMSASMTSDAMYSAAGRGASSERADAPGDGGTDGGTEPAGPGGGIDAHATSKEPVA